MSYLTQSESIWGLSWTKEYGPLKIVTISTEAGFPLAHQLLLLLGFSAYGDYF